MRGIQRLAARHPGAHFLASPGGSTRSRRRLQKRSTMIASSMADSSAAGSSAGHRRGSVPARINPSACMAATTQCGSIAQPFHAAGAQRPTSVICRCAVPPIAGHRGFARPALRRAVSTTSWDRSAPHDLRFRMAEAVAGTGRDHRQPRMGGGDESGIRGLRHAVVQDDHRLWCAAGRRRRCSIARST